jgi:hypothetical protein
MATSMRSPSKTILPLSLMSLTTSLRLELPIESKRACLFVGMAEELARSSVTAAKPMYIFAVMKREEEEE